MGKGMQVQVRMVCCACGSSGVAVYPHSTT